MSKQQSELAIAKPDGTLEKILLTTEESRAMLKAASKTFDLEKMEHRSLQELRKKGPLGAVRNKIRI